MFCKDNEIKEFKKFLLENNINYESGYDYEIIRLKKIWRKIKNENNNSLH